MTTEDEFETHHSEYLQRQKEIAREELQEEHANLLLDFLYDRNVIPDRGDDDHIADSTARNYLRELRFLINHVYERDRYSDNLAELDSQDWNRIIRRVARERGISSGTKRNTCYGARAFVDWLEGSEADKSEIDAPKITHDDIDPETVLEPSEVVEVIESARTERDKALIAVMYECALRRTTLIQLDRRHYLTERFPRIRIPDKQGVKTGSGGERPLSWAQGYLDRWLNTHPVDDPDAPLFTSIRSRDEGERLSSHAVYTMLERTAKRSDVDEERVHPHALRHARATAMRRAENFDRDDIETVLGWTDSTPMHSRYEHASATEEASRTAEKMGVDVSGDEDSHIDECPRCNTPLPANVRYCPSCTLKLEGESPEWWVLFEDVAKDTDPLKQRYDALPSAVPELEELSPEELDHLRDVLGLAEQLMYDGATTEEFSHPFDGVEQFQTEEAGSDAVEMCNHIDEMLQTMYVEAPERFSLVEESVDMDAVTSGEDD